jgi:hypothetical protein
MLTSQNLMNERQKEDSGLPAIDKVHKNIKQLNFRPEVGLSTTTS